MTDDERDAARDDELVRLGREVTKLWRTLEVAAWAVFCTIVILFTIGPGLVR